MEMAACCSPVAEVTSASVFGLGWLPFQQEVGRRGWFEQEVFDFIWDHRHFITKPDMRLYKKIEEQKKAGAEWRKRGLEMFIGDERMRRVAELLEDPQWSRESEAGVASGLAVEAGSIGCS